MSKRDIQLDFAYTNELTPIEHLFIEKFFDTGDYQGMVDYIEDAVLWKRQNYVEIIDERGFGKNTRKIKI